ncbi:hypothetical protein LSH36_558g01002 [Paralvinella palmiformis]|uniref:C1q domain-containing protein n=1 Tax=Paralvinella palmiformis TaxID=53620 RepID=A0AAD9J7Y0_9ANNE|nr:hypothetical protein LSH36_558g01002 [Paralvinella palmiformis]
MTPLLAVKKSRRAQKQTKSRIGTVSGLSAPVPKKIAFFVGLSNNMGPVTEHTDIVFDQVITNIGHAYDVNSGRFTAPVNGTYQFNVIVSAQGRQKAAVMILKNGGMVATVWAESIPYWATASNIAILSLEKGDQSGTRPARERYDIETCFEHYDEACAVRSPEMAFLTYVAPPIEPPPN